MLAGIVILALISSQAPSKAELHRLRAGREWLFNATIKREGEPNEIYFPVGRSDRLYYCWISVDEQHPENDRYVVACWERKGKKPNLAWRIKLLPGKQAATGIILSPACATNLSAEWGSTDPKTGKDSSVKHRIDGFHPDRNSAVWKRARKELEATDALTYYHITWHGDISAGNFVQIHGSRGTKFGDEAMPSFKSFVIPQAEINLMNRRKHR